MPDLDPAERNSQAIPLAVAQVFREALVCRTLEELGKACLVVAAQLTQSRFGFIGEVNRDTGRMDVIAISGPGWEGCKVAPERRPPADFAIHGIYGRVLLDGKPLYTNDPPSHPDSVGTPPGHATLHAFLGAPLLQGDEVIGMIGLGNREGGYAVAQLQALQMLCPAILQAFVSKRAEIALRESEERLRLVAEVTGFGSYDLDVRTKRFIGSPELYAILGLPESTELDEKRCLQLVHPADRDRVQQHMQLAIEMDPVSEERHELEFRILRPDGEMRWVHDTRRALFAGEGLARRAVRVVGTVQNITGRRKADEALRLSEERFRSLVEQAVDGIFVADAQGHYLEANSAGAQMLGYTKEEICQMTIADVIVSDQIGRIPDEVGRFAGGAVAHSEWRFRRKDGTTFIGDVAGRQMSDGRLLGIVRDITEQKLAGEALRNSEERFRQLADSMPQLVWTADAKGQIDYFNQRVRDFDGLLQRPDGTWIWAPFLHPEDAGPTLEAWRTAIQSGEPYECEHRARMADRGYRWVLSRAHPVRDEQGRIVKWYGTSTNIDELKQAQQALQDADRRKNEFLATLAHELRNPLAPIRNAAEILSLKGPTDPPLQAAREMILRQVTHMVRLVDDLLDVSRITRGRLQLRKERVELAGVLEQALETVGPLAQRDCHSVDIQLPQQAIYLDADPVRLSQVFANLLDNACKYSGKDARISVAAAVDGDQVAVQVVDNGIGIPAGELQHVFELFAQLPSATGQPTVGLGIGLSLTRGLVQMHGGTIEVFSEGRGTGSTFTVRLPLAPQQAPIAMAPTAQNRDTTPARILVVDDKEDVVDSLGMLLTLHGHEVETARDGIEAVEVAQRFHPDLILLDLGMPRLDGYGACRRIREQPWGKDIKIVALTGWGQEEDRRRTGQAGFDSHLVKPVEVESVLSLLAERDRSND